MREKSIENFIHTIFLLSIVKSRFIPWEQEALLLKINLLRRERGLIELDNTTLGRHLSRLKQEGKIARLRWYRPSTGNIWIWCDNSRLNPNDRED